MKYKIWNFKDHIVRLWPEKLMFWFIGKLPKRLIYFSSIRLMAHATCGQYANTSPCDLNIMDALKRWETA